MSKDRNYDVVKSEAVKQAKIKLLKEAIEWKEAFGTPDGKRCLVLLKERYYDQHEIADSSPQVTLARAAKRDLVRFVMDQLKYEGE